ncbi:hypothetical protein [uncultured Croceitalea sp.]|uniref:hypothetical protein n=1 Tax=uncultured Croceitalea sp. TaxID=1798908 RepID=UPI00374FACBF
MKKILVLTMITFWFVSCSSDSTDEELIIEEPIIEVVEEDTSSESDTNTSDNMESDGSEGSGRDVVSFVADIQPIINSNCIACHTDPPRNGAPFPLLNFSQVSNRSSSVFSQINAGLMPPSGKLPQDNIDLIEQWIDGGKPR